MYLFVKYNAPCQQQNLKKAIFSIKVKVKVTRSLTWVLFERASLVENAFQIFNFYLLLCKGLTIGKVNVDKRQTDKHARQKQYAPLIIIQSGGI